MEKKKNGKEKKRGKRKKQAVKEEMNGNVKKKRKFEGRN